MANNSDNSVKIFPAKVIGVAGNICIVVLGLATCVLCYLQIKTEENVLRNANFIAKYSHIIIHISCLTIILLDVYTLTRSIFFKRRFHRIFAGIGVFLYLLFETIMAVNALTSKFYKALVFRILVLFIFLFLFTFTLAISKFYQDVKEQRRRIKEQIFERQIARHHKFERVYIPLRPPEQSTSSDP